MVISTGNKENFFFKRDLGGVEQGSEEADGTGASFRSHRGTTFSKVWSELTRKDRNMVGKFQKIVTAARRLKRQGELVKPSPNKTFVQGSLTSAS